MNSYAIESAASVASSIGIGGRIEEEMELIKKRIAQ
jgi:hypothetical protein